MEKILEEIEQAKREPWYRLNNQGVKSRIDGAIERVIEIVRKHMSGKGMNVHANDGWIPVEDERLWNILFEEACVEGEQERRIYNRLKETFGGERSDMDGKL